MQIDDELPGGETIRQHLEHDISAMATLLVDARTTDGELVLERLPDDQHAWLRAESEGPRSVAARLPSTHCSPAPGLFAQTYM